MINTQEFVVMERGNTNWLYNCETAEEIPRLKHDVPHFLPGANPHLTYFADEVGLPLEAVRGGAETMYPEYRAKLRAADVGGRPRRLRRGTAPVSAIPWAAASAARDNRLAQEQFVDVNRGITGSHAQQPSDITTVHVAGGVYMLVGAGANIVVQVGDDGVLVVDTGVGGHDRQMLAAIRQLSKK